MIFVFRVRSSIFSNLFNMFILIHRLFMYSNLRWWLKLENEEVLEYTCWIMEIRTKKKGVEASSSFPRYVSVETSKINRSFFVFSLFVSVILLVLSSIPSLLTSSNSHFRDRIGSCTSRLSWCLNCEKKCSMMKIVDLWELIFQRNDSVAFSGYVFMLIDTGIVNLDDEFNVSGDLGFRLGMNVLDFLDEHSSSSSRTLGFDRKRQREKIGMCFWWFCWVVWFLVEWQWLGPLI